MAREVTSVTHVMVDVETLGTKPGCIILSIGAVAFNPHLNTIDAEFEVNFDPVDSQSRGLTIEASTVLWWLQQGFEARKKVFSQYEVNTQTYPKSKGLSAYSLPDGMLRFRQFFDYIAMIKSADPKSVMVWAKSPQFDLAILEHAMKVAKTPVPWSYRNARDVRTILSVANVADRPASMGVAHRALDDAKHQASLVTEAYFALGLGVA